MKLFSTFFTALFILSAAITQTPKDVYLKFYHKVDGANLEVGSGNYVNWEGTEYTVTRIQFYMSSISLTHNGGEVLDLTDQYVLVNAVENTTYSLGERTLGTLEGVKFDVGVDSAHNHLDPATYAFNHPLAYQSPEMHWGWAAGYRFLAIEGLFDDDGDNIPEKEYQFHVVGNEFLRTVELTTSGEELGDELIIHVEADYNKLFNDLVIADNWWVHGGGPTNELMMNNINDLNVFVAGSNTSSVDELDATLEATIYPNPASEFFVIEYDATDASENNVSVTITDLAGKRIKKMEQLKSSGKITVSNELEQGVYFVSIITNGQVLCTKKVVISK